MARSGYLEKMRLFYNKSQLGDVPGPDTRGEVLLEYLVSSELIA